MLRRLQRTKDELLTPRHTREILKRRYKNHQTLHRARSTRASLRIRPRVASPNGYYQSTMPIPSKEVFDTVCDHNSGRGARETLHICRLQQLRAGLGRTIATRARPARKLDMPPMPPSQALTWAIRCTKYPVRSLAYPCQTIETLRLCIFAAVPSDREWAGSRALQQPQSACP